MRLLFWTIVPLQFFCDVITLIAVIQYVRRRMSWRTAIAESNIACQFGFRLRSVQDFSPRPNPACPWYYPRWTDNRLTHSAPWNFFVVVIAKLYFEITNVHRILHIDSKCILHGICMLRKINANLSATQFYLKHVQYMVYIYNKIHELLSSFAIWDQSYQQTSSTSDNHSIVPLSVNKP